jgi:hypothetical protein
MTSVNYVCPVCRNTLKHDEAYDGGFVSESWAECACGYEFNFAYGGYREVIMGVELLFEQVFDVSRRELLISAARRLLDVN